MSEINKHVISRDISSGQVYMDSLNQARENCVMLSNKSCERKSDALIYTGENNFNTERKLLEKLPMSLDKG